MKDIDIIKLIKLIKKTTPAASARAPRRGEKTKKTTKKSKKKEQRQNTDRIASLKPSIISTGLYEPGFHTQQIYSDPNRRENENFIEYKKTRGSMPSESRSNLPSEIELYKEYETIKKLSKAEIQSTLENKNIKSQALERQKYIDLLQINEEKRLQKEQLQLAKQQTKTKTKIKGIRNPIQLNNKIVPTVAPQVGFSLEDSIDVGTTVGGTSDEFIIPQSQEQGASEGPRIISVGASAGIIKKRGRPKKSN